MKKYIILLPVLLLLSLTGFTQNFKAFHFTPDTTFLPDGNGASYTTSLFVDGYAAGQTIISPYDIISLCVDMEHSYLGDLNISIECPNGQSIVLKPYPGGGGTFMGEPIDNDSDLNPGIGYDYCWTPNPEFGTMLEMADTVQTLPPGSYAPEESFANLIGCPLNGFWTITITDNLSVDNGYVFNWGLNLLHDPSCYTTAYGKLYVDTNGNGLFDEGEPPIPNQLVVAEPGPYYGYSNANGDYHMYLDSGSYVVQPHNVEAPWLGTNPETMNIEISTNELDTIYGLDFGYNANIFCPDLNVDVTVSTIAVCISPQVFVSYTNNGTDIAEDALITLELDENMTYISGGNLISQDGNTLIFNVGDIQIGESGSFIVYTDYSCDPETAGLTACVEAVITPNDPCEDPDPEWDHSSVSVEGYCAEDTAVCFTIENTGEPGEGDMQGTSQYRIYENENLVATEEFQIAGGETIEICWPANGSTIRLEADQRPGHPGNSHPQDAIEGCGNPEYTFGQILNVPQDDQDEFVEIDCQEVLASYDPNDKRVVPTGLTEEHFIDTTMPLEYTIRFQNTGTYPAQLVIVRDTISELLDISTFRHLASSHECDIDFPAGNIIRWTFNNIWLADSASNPEGSIGFLKFRIEQTPGLEYGEEIFNNAGIYFDYNLPIITNTTHNKIGKFNGVILSEPVNYNKSNKIEIYPNPATEKINVKSNETIVSIQVFDVQGRLIKNIKDINSRFHTFDRGDLENGLYYYQINSQNGISASGKLVLTD